MSPEFYWIALVATTILSAARITRLFTWDKFPPTKAIRRAWARATSGTHWVWLFFCGYCFSFWATAAVVVAGLYAGVYDSDYPATTPMWGAVWWIFNGIFATSYLAAFFMSIDGDDGDMDEDDVLALAEALHPESD